MHVVDREHERHGSCDRRDGFLEGSRQTMARLQIDRGAVRGQLTELTGELGPCASDERGGRGKSLGRDVGSQCEKLTYERARRRERARVCGGICAGDRDAQQLSLQRDLGQKSRSPASRIAVDEQRRATTRLCGNDAADDTLERRIALDELGTEQIRLRRPDIELRLEVADYREPIDDLRCACRTRERVEREERQDESAELGRYGGGQQI